MLSWYDPGVRHWALRNDWTLFYTDYPLPGMRLFVESPPALSCVYCAQHRHGSLLPGEKKWFARHLLSLESDSRHPPEFANVGVLRLRTTSRTSQVNPLHEVLLAVGMMLLRPWRCFPAKRRRLRTPPRDGQNLPRRPASLYKAETANNSPSAL